MLKLQYFGHLMGRMDSFKKTLMLGKIEGGRRRGMRWLRGWDGWITSPMSWVWVNSGRWTGKPSMLQSMGLQSQTRLSNWTELNWTCLHINLYLDGNRFFFIFTLFYFTILNWFCHTLTWIHHGCTWVPKHEPPSYLPAHNISLGQAKPIQYCKVK